MATVQIPAFAQSAVCTWTSNSGDGDPRTLDYILVKKECVPFVLQSSVHTEVDNGHDVDDHFPLAVSIGYSIHTTGFSGNKGFRVSRDQLSDKVSRRRFITLLSKIPSPAWKVGIDAHDFVLRSSISRAVRLAFPKPKRTAKKPYASQELLDIVQTRCELKHEARLLRWVARSPDWKHPVFIEFSAHVIAYTASIKTLLRASRKLVRNISRYDLSRFTLSVASKVSHITLKTQIGRASCRERVCAVCPSILLSYGGRQRTRCR